MKMQKIKTTTQDKEHKGEKKNDKNKKYKSL